jgi:predicted phage terminase large subunit-like protein
MPSFSLTPRQHEANALLAGPATHCMLFGGSRSGKTFLIVRAIILRALKAPRSRHAVLRFRFNAVKASVIFDTLPKVFELCFPEIKYELNKTDWICELPNGSTIVFGGLDDKERTEKILGQEYATVFLNECSQIPWESRGIAVTRLAQQCPAFIDGAEQGALRLKMYLDCNPPDKGHWTYRLFVQGIDPETKKPVANTNEYACMRVNPLDNQINLPPNYLDSLRGLSGRMQRRFLEGEFRDANPYALFSAESLDKWRHLHGTLPDMQRIVVAVDPSGSGDTDNQDNDAIGIVVAGLGTDGNGYVLEDLTVKAGPSTWGRIATTAYDRHRADLIVAETNYGGAMVAQVIQTSRPRTPYKEVSASRGKVVRAEPISSLVDDGKVRLVGNFPELEEELAGFTTGGYIGENSPNRADAFVWAFSELFPGLVRAAKKTEARSKNYDRPSGGWMAV